ncbi:polysaccharide deacetylase family protein [Bacteroides stercorirosoris]|uniref:Polysaccharide deacetylase n=1 Tax=Bacteroides stercorirosoris TaxID=871324 RepID=A0A1M6JP98_9BACE|nr:polysaccharide deacetylase family protein [Bacteroides stercorirosoris]SHJ48468.1 Polysaccharide deacetylase [Bacteroides stercorirosoris]
MNGHFLISLDFELVWGLAGWDLSQIEHYKQNLFSAKDALYKIVCLLEKYNMKCTVGYVGAMNHVSQQELYNTNNILIPAYSNHLYASFGSLLPYMNRELDERLFLAHQEIEMLQKKANVEVASHTYSHYYCLEEGQTIDDFENDVRMAITNAKKQGVNLVSIIFPRNQVNDDYLKVCHKYGFTHFRGMINTALYKPTKTVFRYSPMGALRFLDTYLNISGSNTYSIENTVGKDLIDVPGSRFLRPYSSKFFFLEKLKMRRIKNSMTDAAKKGHIYHLWWHPHNFGINMSENLSQLEEICCHFDHLKKVYGLKTSFISDI